MTCSGATTTGLGGRQFGFVAPQYDALRPDTDLATLAIGANDIGMGPVVPTCASLLADPIRPTCEERYTRGGPDGLADPSPRAGGRGAGGRVPHAGLIVADAGGSRAGQHPDA